MIELGQQFGLYVVKEVFETSETQACCCAEDPFFNRDVTLKTFSTEPFLEENKLELLEAFLERLAILDHPSIAPIYDSGLEENNVYYTSTSISGPNLLQRLDAPLTEKEALRGVFELAQALENAFEEGFEQGPLRAEKVFFDAEGRALLFDFGIDSAVKKILAGEFNAEAQVSAEGVAATLYSLGELLLQMLLGPAYAADAQVDDLCASIENAKIRQLIGRFLLPGECRFASFAELVDELRSLDEVEEQQITPPPKIEFAEPDSFGRPAEEDPPASEQTEKMVADVRRLVAEKNGLQKALDNALYERNLVDEKLNEGQRQLALVKQDVAKAKEEANVAWELVAGQKYDRWRPMAWAVGGFVVGFILSGSYGYYYSEQTKTELLAKLKANEELIKTAAWRSAEQNKKSEPAAPVADLAEVEKPQAEEAVVEAEQEEAQASIIVPVEPVAEETRHWWPAGSEFSAAAAVPIEQIKAALGFGGQGQQTALSERLRQEVTATVVRWAESWSRQDLGGYFSAYSENYQPELGRSQQEWRDMRRSRVTRPQWIELDIDDIRVRKVGENRIQVKLKQRYRSDYYQDQILKSINLIKEDGEWRILMERSLGMISTTDIVGG